eukprot:scaffold5222_cov63-Phaeocystis_antarctica.AAC.1
MERRSQLQAAMNARRRDVKRAAANCYTRIQGGNVSLLLSIPQILRGCQSNAGPAAQRVVSYEGSPRCHRGHYDGSPTTVGTPHEIAQHRGYTAKSLSARYGFSKTAMGMKPRSSGLGQVLFVYV